MSDYYEILGVSREASTSDIRKAYSIIAREKHPDRVTDPVAKERAQEFFKDATAAFNTLLNEKSRQEYDRSLSRPRLTTPAEIAQDAYQRGLASLEARDAPAAVELLRSAVHHQPGETRYHEALAAALARTAQGMREAIQCLERAIQLSPQSAGLHADLATLFLREGLSLRARREAELALRLAPHDPRVQRIAAEAGAARGPEPSGEGGSFLDRLRKKP
jgi:tetratricopeptide (TPR) repeat protein